MGKSTTHDGLEEEKESDDGEKFTGGALAGGQCLRDLRRKEWRGIILFAFPSEEVVLAENEKDEAQAYEERDQA